MNQDLKKRPNFIQVMEQKQSKKAEKEIQEALEGNHLVERI
jgi:hypothetical protein